MKRRSAAVLLLVWRADDWFTNGSWRHPVFLRTGDSAACRHVRTLSRWLRP